MKKIEINKEPSTTSEMANYKAAIEKFDSLKARNDYFTNDSELNQLGKELYQKYGMKNESFKIFELAIREFPDSLLLKDSYDELLSQNKSKK